MESFRRTFAWTLRIRVEAVELAGAALVTAGLHCVYRPSALIFAGAALVFVAQGLEHDE